MRKTKDIKRKRREAGIAYRRGQRKEAYKLWGEAKKDLDELRGRNQPKPAKAETPAAEGAAS